MMSQRAISTGHGRPTKNAIERRFAICCSIANGSWPIRKRPATSQRTGTPPEPMPVMPSSVWTSTTWMRAAVVDTGCQVGWNGFGIGYSKRRTLTAVIFMGGTPSTDALSTDTLTDSRMAGRCARLRVRRIQLGLEYRLLAVEFLAGFGDLLWRQVQAIEVVLPRRIFRPAVRRLHRRKRCVRGLEQVKRHRDETSLARQVARLA